MRCAVRLRGNDTQDPSVSDGNDIAGWARAHTACFHAQPLIEMRGSEKLPVGFTLDLYASVPMEKAPGEERREAAGEVRGRLRGILESALADQGGQPLLEIEPMRTAAVLRPENEMKPEITLRARIVHRETFETLTPEERQRMSAFEKKLAAMGLRSGRW
jgi:hypothetical protein